MADDGEQQWERLRVELAGKEPPVSDEWLRHLHSTYVQRFLADNERIWTTAAILVPIALAAFPAYFALKERDPWSAVIFATFSITVLSFWHAVAGRHRFFQTQAGNVARFLESYILGDQTERNMFAAARADVRAPRPRVETARRALLTGTVVLWALIVYLAWTGLLPKA